MKLEDFISQTLLGINEGIKVAREKTGDQQAVPTEIDFESDDAQGKDIFKRGVWRGGYSNKWKPFTFVDFDVLVEASETTGANVGEGGVNVVMLKANSENQSSAHRIKFTIPFSLRWTMQLIILITTIITALATTTAAIIAIMAYLRQSKHYRDQFQQANEHHKGKLDLDEKLQQKQMMHEKSAAAQRREERALRGLPS